MSVFDRASVIPFAIAQADCDLLNGEEDDEGIEYRPLQYGGGWVIGIFEFGTHVFTL